MGHKPLFLLCVCIYHFSSSGMYISECSILGYRGDGFGCDLNGVSGIKNQHFSHIWHQKPALNGVSGIKNQHFSHTILSKKHVFSRQMSHKSTPVAFSDSPSFAILLILLTFPIAGTIREAIKFKKLFFSQNRKFFLQSVLSPNPSIHSKILYFGYPSASKPSFLLVF